MPLNIPVIRQLMAAVLNHPHEFDMLLMWQPAHYRLYEPTKGCGTACCFAGFTVALIENVSLEKIREIDGDQDCWSIAATALGLSEDQAESVFLRSHWPERYRVQYDNAATDQERAQSGADRLEHLIQTGE